MSADKVFFEPVVLGTFSHEKGCLWKMLVESIGCDEFTIGWSKSGIEINELVFASGSGAVEIGIEAKCQSSNFTRYICRQDFWCRVEARQHKTCLKSATKKKAKLQMTIRTTPNPHVLEMEIIIEGGGGGPAVTERHVMDCNLVEATSRWEHPKVSCYRPEVSVISDVLQGIKGFNSSSREKAYYIRTQAAQGYFWIGTISPGLPGSSKVVGTLVENYPDYEVDAEGWLACKKCNRYVGACECQSDEDCGCACKCACDLCGWATYECGCLCDFCGKSLRECRCRAFDLATRRYPYSVILRLSKTVPFKFPIRFAESKELNLALRIKFTIIFGNSVLGDVTMYARDVDTIQSALEKARKGNPPAKAAKKK